MRYDKRDPDPQVITLTRAGHFLWFQLFNAKLTSTHQQRMALLEAIEIIQEAKRTVKAEMAANRASQFASRKHLFAKVDFEAMS